MDIREKLIELLHVAVCDYNCDECKYSVSDEVCIRHLEEMAADYLIANGVMIQKQGQWTENQQTTYDSIWGEDVYWYTYTCSVCGSEAMNNFDYCPFCGNPMLPTQPKGE